MKMESTLVERVRHVVRVVYYMLRKGLVSKRKLMIMDLHLLLKRGKLAGKALANLITFHHHHHGGAGAASSSAAAAAAFSCASVDRSRDVEFSCTNTPSSSSFFRVATNRNRRNRRNRRAGDDDDLGAYDAAAIAKAFEMLGDDDAAAGADWMAATPSPALTWSGGAFWKSPALAAAGPVRQLRITDSPFPVTEEEECGCGERVDVAAEEFIRRFYEQLRMQRSAAATPEYYRR